MNPRVSESKAPTRVWNASRQSVTEFLQRAGARLHAERPGRQVYNLGDGSAALVEPRGREFRVSLFGSVAACGC